VIIIPPPPHALLTVSHDLPVRRLPLCRGLAPACFAFRQQVQTNPLRGRTCHSSAPEPELMCESYCAFATCDNSSNPLAAAARGVAKFSFKRVLLCCRILLRLTGVAFRPAADACPLPIFVKAPTS
jgi:hypothetical protein